MSASQGGNRWSWRMRLALCVCVALLLSSIALLVYLKFVRHIDRMQDVASAITSPLPVFNPAQPLVNFGTLSQPMTLLFMGTDMVYDDPKRRHMDVQSCRGNSDTIMVVFFNPYRNAVSVLHIPRDTEAYVGKYGIRKLNSANVLGGPDLAKETVASLLDVPVDHYLIMNIEGLVDLVNELGGITVTVPKKMSYMDWTGKLKIDLQPGVHTLTGNQAMGFVRFRHDALGDIGRIQRQQIFLQAVLKKAMEPASWLHVPALVQIAQRSIQTDLSNIQLFEALNFIHSVPKDNFKFVMLPGQFAANGDWLADTNSRLIAHQLANPDEDVITSRRNISVCVINATTNPTFGSQVAKALRQLGYVTCVGADDREPISSHTQIIAQYGNISNARMMQRDLGGIGDVVKASIGNLTTALTVVAHDDLKLDAIRMSSEDLPYVPPAAPPQPLVVAPSLLQGSGSQGGDNQNAPPEDKQPATEGNPPGDTDAPPATGDKLDWSTPEDKPGDTVDGTATGTPDGQASDSAQGQQ